MEADYVVVGAGPAGSIVAASLARPGRTVILIEEGERRESRFARVPAAALLAPTGRGRSRMLSSEPDPTAAGRRLPFAAPRGLCAGRELDGSVYAPGLTADYDAWPTLGAAGWSYADVAPIFAEFEGRPGRSAAAAPALPRVTAATHPAALAFLSACDSAGLPLIGADRLDDAPGAMAAQLLLSHGRRVTAADLWLRPRLRQRELSLLERTRVLALQLDGKQCIGVFARRDGQELQIRARAEVILAAGVFGSPKLLMLSGVGPPGLLESAGVRLRHPLAGVGGHLSDHAGISVAAELNVKALARRDRWPPRALAHYLRWLAGGGGPYATPALLAKARAPSAASGPHAVLHLGLTPAVLAADGHTLGLEHGATITIHARRTRSYGRLRLSGPELDDPLKIEHLLLSDPDEVRALGDGVQLARRLFAAPAFAALGAREVEPDEASATEPGLEALVRARARPLGHAVGTCRIGAADDADAVVDARLRVHGLAGVRVVDAAVMPRVPGDSAAAAAMMLAVRAARLIEEGP